MRCHRKHGSFGIGIRPPVEDTGSGDSLITNIKAGLGSGITIVLKLTVRLLEHSIDSLHLSFIFYDLIFWLELYIIF
jgi:hypothetical protein